MKKLWQLAFQSNTNTDAIESFLQKKGFEISYITLENDDMCQVCLTGDKEALLELKNHPYFSHNFSLSESQITEIDWQEQARLHAPKFNNGLIEIELGHESFYLTPGAAFGDASHPTTKLMLSLMQNRMNDQIVLDIGTGSGILAIASILLGAKLCYGVEIDKEAIQLARKNIELNQLQEQIFIVEQAGLAQLKAPLLIVINMISSEMSYVLKEYEDFFALPGITILSGLLIQEKAETLKKFEKRGWKLLAEETLEGWVGLVIERP